MLAFSILSGAEPCTRLQHKLPSTLCGQIQAIDATNWKMTYSYMGGMVDQDTVVQLYMRVVIES